MYGTLEGWIEYAALRGLIVPDSPSSEAAIVRASDYIRTRYVLRFMDLYDDTDPRVIEATYIAAGYELTKPGFWSTAVTPSQLKVLTGVDTLRWTPVETKGVYGIDNMLPISPAIEALLVPLTRWGMPAVFVA